jgi:hypothetical protein
MRCTNAAALMIHRVPMNSTRGVQVPSRRRRRKLRIACPAVKVPSSVEDLNALSAISTPESWMFRRRL